MVEGDIQEVSVFPVCRVDGSGQVSTDDITNARPEERLLDLLFIDT